MSNTAKAQIKIEPLTQAQLHEELFSKYDERNMDKVGGSFRLPRLLRGESKDFNRATAQAALRFSEEQVFQPERYEFDYMVNRKLFSDMGIRFWQFRSNSPVTRDPERMTEMVERLVKANVLTPEEGRMLAGDVFNRDFRMITAPWVKQPIPLTLAGFTPDGSEPSDADKTDSLDETGRLMPAQDKLFEILSAGSTSKEKSRQQLIDLAKRLVRIRSELSAEEAHMASEKLVEADRVVSGTRKGAIKTFDLKIDSSLNETDQRIARHVAWSQGNFVRDEYWRRADRASQQAREIVSYGLEGGLGNDDISRKLSSELSTTIVGKSQSYWDVVASSFTGRARSFTMLSSFKDAGIEQYVWSSVLDESTTEICRFMDGKVFSVSAGLDLFDQVESLENPEDIKQTQPWVRTGVDERGNQFLFIDRNGAKVPVAQVVESAMGRRDETGKFARSMSQKELESNGISLPPAHGLCRSNVLTL